MSDYILWLRLNFQKTSLEFLTGNILNAGLATEILRDSVSVKLKYFYSFIPVDKLHMGEGEVSHFAVELSFPLPVYGHFGYFDNVANLEL